MRPLEQECGKVSKYQLEGFTTCQGSKNPTTSLEQFTDVFCAARFSAATQELVLELVESQR